MSVRPREAFEASQTFSLRAALGGDATAPQLPQSTGGNLRFNLQGLQGLQAPAQTSSPPSSAPAPASLGRSVQSFPAGLSLRFAHAPAVEPQAAPTPFKQPAALPNLSFTSMSQGSNKVRQLGGSMRSAADVKESASSKADVMRLTAYVDELTSRLKKTQSRLDQTETQLTRTSQVLCHERQASDQMLGGYKKDLAQAHETEAKLRADVTQSKSKSSLKDNTFMASVGSALASDEQVRMQQRNLTELETKVGAMGEFKVKLEAEVAKLTALRDSASKELEAIRTAREEYSAVVKATAEELATAKTDLATVREEHSEIVERLASAKVEEATLGEALSSLRTDKASAEQESASAKQATQAMILEHGDISGKVAEITKRVAELGTKEANAAAVLLQTEARCAQAEERARIPAFALEETGSCSLHRAEKDEEAEEDEKDEEDERDEKDAEQAEEAPPAGDADTQATVPAAPAPKAPRRAVISGALAPDRQLCSGVPDCKTSARAHAPNPAANIAAVLATDAPVGMTLQRVAFVGSEHCVLDTGSTGGNPGNDDRTALMINAVVGDLKEKLLEISQQQPVWRAVAPLA